MAGRDGTGLGPASLPLVAPLPLVLLDHPLDYIAADHVRQRSVAEALRRFAESRRADRGALESIVGFLDLDLPMHYRDEEEDLFSAVRRRALPADDLGPILDRLCEDHRQALPLVASIVEALLRKPVADPVTLSKPLCRTMLAYADSERRHLAIENGVVLVIARIRLTAKDLRAISRSMKARRGVAV